MAVHFSTEGLTKQWPRRRLKRKKKDDDPLTILMKKTFGEQSAQRASSSFSHRPDEEGNIERVTKPRRRKRATTAQGTEHSRVSFAQHNIDLPENLLEDPLSQLNALIQTLDEEEETETQLSMWEFRKVEFEARWLAHRQKIFQLMVELEAPPEEDTICDACREESAQIRCFDCIGTLLCHRCDVIIHRCNPMHERWKWSNGYLQKVPQDWSFPADTHPSFVCFKCNGCSCSAEPHGSYIVITLRGRYDIKKYRTRCNDCKTLNPDSDLRNIINRGYWPGNPDLSRSDYLFDRKVLELWQEIYRHLPGSSLAGFISALNDISDTHGRTPTINHPLFSRAVSEYGYCSMEIKMMKHQDSLKCPPCSINQHSAHVDGNHKLYRFKSAGSSNDCKEPYHKDRFIFDDEVVKQHLNQVYTAHPSRRKNTHDDIFCGNSKWQAARESRNRSEKLDETGLVVAGCRHAIAQRAVNMTEGELYGYSHYLHIYFLMQQGIDYLFQDVMCKYWPWANKVGVTSTLWQRGITCIKPALSVFHSKAHSWHCQVCWGGRYVDGAGAGAGEDMEQAFSHLSRIGTTTKHMSKAGRIDMITDHVLFWNRRKIKTMPRLLCKRYIRVQKQLKEVERQKADLMDTLDITPAHLKKWTDDVIKTATAVHKSAEFRAPKMKLLQQKFVLEEQLKSCNILQKYVDTSNEGLSTILGMSQLFESVSEQVKGKKVKEKRLKDVNEALQIEYHGADLAEKAKIAAIEEASSILQADIELTVNTICHRQHAISEFADTSKKRASYRSKIAKEKAVVEKLLSKLAKVNVLRDDLQCSYNKEKILKGDFPWQTTAEPDWASKKQVADMCMLHDRLKEEEPLLLSEMRNFLQFHMDVKKVLQIEITSLEVELDMVDVTAPPLQAAEQNAQPEEQYPQPREEVNQQDVTAPPLQAAEQNAQPEEQYPQPREEERLLRYNEDGMIKSSGAIKGLLAIKRRGVEEANTQIEFGLTGFKKVTSNDFNDIVFEDDSDHEIEEVSDEEAEETELILDQDIE